MTTLRSHNLAQAIRGTSAVALLALLALFALGHVRAVADDPDPLNNTTATLVETYTSPSRPAVTRHYFFELESVSSVDYNYLPVGDYSVTGSNVTIDINRNTLIELHYVGTLSAGVISGTFTGADYSSDPNGIPVAGTFSTGDPNEGPSIVVEYPLGTRLASGASTVDFGNGFTVGARPAIAKVKFIIKNTGTNPLNISDAAVSSGPFRVTTKPGKKVAGGGKASTSLTLQMTPNDPIRFDGNPPAPSTEEGRLLIYSDDPGTPIFRIKLTGQSGGFSPQ